MNNKTISPSSVSNRHVLQATDQKNEETQTRKEEKAPAPAPQAPYFQYNNRSYYNDSMGGGYQGL